MIETPERRSPWATLAVRAAALWLLAGALAKLFLGTPKDLPELIRKLTPFDLDLTFHLVIAVELAIVWLCMLKPRWGWPVLLALFVFFEFVLGSQLSAGAKSCGCFGATIKVSPYLMVAVDGALLITLLATRPWRTIEASGANPLVLAGAIGISAIVPWIAIPAQGDATKPEHERYVMLEPASWVNKNVLEIGQLTRWVPEDKLPTDGKIVLWRQSCDHCAAHLRKMASQDDGSQPIVLLQIKDDLKSSREVDAMPNGPHVTMIAMPDDLEFPIETPWEIHVEGGVVKEALDREHAEALDGAASK
jgi:hypothetical protein